MASPSTSSHSPSTSTHDAIEARKAKIEEACEAAAKFVEIYYDRLDNTAKRHTVSKMYLDNATVSWNGNKIEGKNSRQCQNVT